MSEGFQVDMGFVNSIVAPLRQSVEVARAVHARSGQLAAGMGACGSDRLAGASGQMLGRWGYGMGLVATDADQAASGLDRAAAAYAHAERAIGRAATELAEPIPDAGRGSG